jgi:hypothetical protein
VVRVFDMSSSLFVEIARNQTLRSIALTSAICVFASGCRQANVVSDPATSNSVAPAPATTEVARANYVPPNTTLDVQLDQALGTKHSRVGDRFTGTVRQDIRAADGSVVVPSGAVVSGVVSQLKTSGHTGEQAAIGLAFQSIAVGGRALPLAANVVDAKVETSRSGKGVARGAGGGALAGGVIGAILGGGSGALKGGLVGAAGGTLIGLGTGDVQAELPAGTVMTLRTTQPINLESA